jgi:hypothetical protein
LQCFLNNRHGIKIVMNWLDATGAPKEHVHDVGWGGNGKPSATANFRRWGSTFDVTQRGPLLAQRVGEG